MTVSIFVDTSDAPDGPSPEWGRITYGLASGGVSPSYRISHKDALELARIIFLAIGQDEGAI